MRPLCLQIDGEVLARSIDFVRVAPHKTANPDPPAGGADCLSRSIRCGGFGGVSRAAKGADCKSAGYAFVGSSPTSPTTLKTKRKMKNGPQRCGPFHVVHVVQFS